MLLIEALLPGDLHRSVIIYGHAARPFERAAFLYSLFDLFGGNSAVCDTAVDLIQNAFVHAGEQLAFQQLGNLQLIEAVRQAEKILDLAAECIEFVLIHALQPFADGVIAVGRVRFGEPANQAGKEGRASQTPIKGGEQYVGSQIPQIAAVAVLIPGKAPDQLPESLAVAELFHLDQRGILRFFQFPGEDRPQDCGERVLCRPGECCRNVHMQLAGGMIAPAELFQFGHSLLILEELGVALNRLAQLDGVVRPQLVHSHGEQIRPKFFAVQLQIQQPVVPDICIADRVIDQEV